MRNGRLCVLVDDGTAAGFGVERAPGPSEIFELKGPVRYVVGRNSSPRSFLDVSWISPSSTLSSPFFFALIDDRPHQQKSRADIISAKLQPPINGRAIPPSRPASSASIASSQVAEGGLHCQQQNMEPE